MQVTAYHQKRAWLWSCDCFKILPFVVMQCIARGLSAIAELLVSFNFKTNFDVILLGHLELLFDLLVDLWHTFRAHLALVLRCV